jgi:hypothetical protein
MHWRFQFYWIPDLRLATLVRNKSLFRLLLYAGSAPAGNSTYRKRLAVNRSAAYETNAIKGGRLSYSIATRFAMWERG